MIDAVLYARFSPRPKDKDAIQKQMRDMHDWCDDHEVNPRLCCFDPAVSGTVHMWNRPGLRIALESLKPNELLVVRNLRRIARKTSVGLAIEEYVFDEAKAGLASVEDGGILENTPHARFTRTVLYAVHDLQRVEGNDRTSRRMLAGIKEGRKLSSQPNYGYRFEGDRMVESSAEQLILSHIRTRRGMGHGARRIARWLNFYGYANRGKDWTPSAVQRILNRA